MLTDLRFRPGLYPILQATGDLTGFLALQCTQQNALLLRRERKSLCLTRLDGITSSVLASTASIVQS